MASSPPPPPPPPPLTPCVAVRAQYGSHTDWVEKVKERMAKECGSSDLSTRASDLGGVQMEGMNENKRAFQIYEGKQDVTIAMKNGLADRCVKIHKDGKLDAIDSDAKDIKVDTFPVFADAKKLGEYGCGLAVQIYFNFHVDGMVRAPTSPSPSPPPSSSPRVSSVRPHAHRALLAAAETFLAALRHLDLHDGGERQPERSAQHVPRARLRVPAE